MLLIALCLLLCHGSVARKPSIEAIAPTKYCELAEIANSNNLGRACLANHTYGFLNLGFRCDIGYAPYPGGVNAVRSCIEDPCFEPDVVELNTLCRPVWNAPLRAYRPVSTGCRPGYLPVINITSGSIEECQAEPCYTSFCVPGFACTRSYDTDKGKWIPLCSVPQQAPCLLQYSPMDESKGQLVIDDGQGGGCGFKNQAKTTAARPSVLGRAGDIFSAFQGAECRVRAKENVVCSLTAPNGTVVAEVTEEESYTFCKVEPESEIEVGGVVVQPAVNPFVNMPLTASCRPL